MEMMAACSPLLRSGQSPIAQMMHINPSIPSPSSLLLEARRERELARMDANFSSLLSRSLVWSILNVI
eukprot:scaffold7085_cov108-Skeletonema_dohrnii-CCMP3373.AAC.2